MQGVKKNPSSKESRVVLWADQLRRMREMQYAYHRKFFHGLYFFLGLVVVCLLWDSPLSLALVPFLVVTAGTQSCFYLHFVDFARLHARHLETRLNKALGKGTMVGSEIEDVYFYPIEAPKIGGFLPSAGATALGDPAGLHLATGDHELGKLEHLFDQSVAQRGLAKLGIEHAGHGFLHLVDQLVNDAEVS